MLESKSHMLEILEALIESIWVSCYLFIADCKKFIKSLGRYLLPLGTLLFQISIVIEFGLLIYLLISFFFVAGISMLISLFMIVIALSVLQSYFKRSRSYTPIDPIHLGGTKLLFIGAQIVLLVGISILIAFKIQRGDNGVKNTLSVEQNSQEVQKTVQVNQSENIRKSPEKNGQKTFSNNNAGPPQLTTKAEYGSTQEVTKQLDKRAKESEERGSALSTPEALYRSIITASLSDRPTVITKSRGQSVNWRLRFLKRYKVEEQDHYVLWFCNDYANYESNTSIPIVYYNVYPSKMDWTLKLHPGEEILVEGRIYSIDWEGKPRLAIGLADSCKLTRL
jgi:hypothetical protein